jgi:molybdopterin converting factor small subunit
MAIVYLSSALCRLVHQPAGGFIVQGNKISECLDFLVAQNPKLKIYIYQNETDLQQYLSIYLNGKDIRFLNKQKLNVTENDKIEIIAALAGG